MRTKQERFAVRMCALAVRSALLAMAAVATAQAAEGDDNLIRELTQPTSWFELGVGYVTRDSFKFGEYNGLFRKGAFAIGAFDVRGGGAWDSDDPTRWRVSGTDLGLDTRQIDGEYRQQGRFKVSAGYEELFRARSDTFQTPYLGAGSDFLSLPATWVKPVVPQLNNNLNFRGLSPVTGLASALVSGAIKQPTAAQQAQVASQIAADVPLWNDVDLSTKRKRIDGGFSYQIDRNWEFKATVRHEKKEGLKPMGAVTSQVAEYATIIPDLIDQTTDQYNVSLAYTDPQKFFQVAYYGSVFHNDVGGITWQDVSDPTKTATISSAPSNDFHQVLLTGGYNFNKTTKLVLFGSYGRNTQNDAFLTAGQNNQFPVGLPVSSLDGKVIDTAFNAKLTAKPVRGLNLAAAYKYHDRDNETPINTYFFQDANEAASRNAQTNAINPSPFNAALGLPPGTLASNINIYANRPYSKKLNQATVDADYQVARGHTIAGGYEYEQIDRECPGSWINCVDAPKTRESTVKAEWRGNVVENVSARVAYAWSRRTVDYDENAFLALVPAANLVPAGGATISAYQYLLQTGLTGFGPVAGFPAAPLTGNAAIFSPNNNILPQALYGSRNNINELVGMRRFNMADRTRNKVRSLLNWDATDRISLQAAADFNHDDYDNSIYGLTGAQSWAFNLDGSFAATADLSLTAWYTHEDIKSQSAGFGFSSNTSAANVGGVAGNTVVSGGCFPTVLQRNNNAKIDPCNAWTNEQRDKVDSAAIGFRWKRLMAGRLDLAGDLVYTHARTSIDMTGGNYVNNPFAVANQPAVNPAVLFIPAQNFPTVTTSTVDVRLTGDYAIDKSSTVRALYWYSHLRDSDYVYDGMQFGTLTNVIPTNEQPFRYNVHVIGVAYVYRWQ
jgi:hypothetical protein